MAGTANLYDVWRLRQLNGNAVSLTTGGVKVMITTSGYVPDQNLHDFKDDVTNEVSGTGYTAGGEVLVNPVLTLSTLGQLVFDADDITLASSAAGFSNGFNLVFYFNTGSASTSGLIGSHTATETFGNTAGSLLITFATGGIIVSPR